MVAVCLLLGALLAGCGLNVTVMRTMPLHYGAHQWNIQYKNFMEYLKVQSALIGLKMRLTSNSLRTLPRSCSA